MSSTSTVRTQTNTHRGGTPFRGGYSPRRGGFGYGVPYRGRASPFRSRPSRTNIPGRDILEGLVPMPQKTIYRDHYIHSSDIVLEDLQYLGSYNWLEADEPSIVVPGSPRKWLDKATPFAVAPDTGKSFIDQNGFRMRDYPLLPMFRAIDIMEADRIAADAKAEVFDWAGVDIVTDRNSLRKILAWAEGDDVTFRIDIQLAGERTMLLHRWEAHQTEAAEGTGWANNFELETTAAGPGCELGTLVGHHRIVSYDLAGLQVVVRSEVDAYNPELCKPSAAKVQAGTSVKASTPATDKADSTATTTADPVDTLDSLTDALSSLSVNSTSSSPGNPSLLIVRGGQVVPQAALIKLKTRIDWKAAQFDWQNAYPQLFLGGCPTLHIGVHTKGTFFEVRKKHLDDPDLRGVARTAQNGLKRLRAALGEVHNFAMANGKEARRSLVCRDGKLEVMQRESADSFLPDEILRRFDA